MADWFLNCSCLSPEVQDENDIILEDQPAVGIVDSDGKAVDFEESPIEDDEEETKAPTPVVPEKKIETTRIAAAEPTPEKTKQAVIPLAAVPVQKETSSTVVTPPTQAEPKENPEPPPVSDVSEKKVAPPPLSDVEEKKAAPPVVESKKELSPELIAIKNDLKKGIPVKKHCSDKKIRSRMLVLSSDEKYVGWKLKQPTNEMIALIEIQEVREATTVDPKTIGDPKHPKGMGGTEILRKTCEGFAVAKRAFSFILAKRTLDIEVDSEEEAKKLVAAFKELVTLAKN
mmetsp:Transcript_19587/g.25349  ORF Transcript_19587/g.25349 Transcript_19587/m.25349 type:complete len:286 (-) Transcript_19587:814-1671(-)